MNIASNSLTDEEIIRKIQMGDNDVLLTLYKRNIEPVKSLVLRNSGQIADAEDLLQDALVAVWQKISKSDFVLSARLDTFIYAIARNLWLKTLRKKGKTVSHAFDKEDINIIEDNASEIGTDDKAAILTQYLNQLGEVCREVLSLFYFEQWEMEKIAVKLNFANADTAKAKKYQCKKKLEDLIKQHYKKEDFF